MFKFLMNTIMPILYIFGGIIMERYTQSPLVFAFYGALCVFCMVAANESIDKYNEENKD